VAKVNLPSPYLGSGEPRARSGLLARFRPGKATVAGEALVPSGDRDGGVAGLHPAVRDDARSISAETISAAEARQARPRACANPSRASLPRSRRNLGADEEGAGSEL